MRAQSTWLGPQQAASNSKVQPDNGSDSQLPGRQHPFYYKMSTLVPNVAHAVSGSTQPQTDKHPHATHTPSMQHKKCQRDAEWLPGSTTHTVERAFLLYHEAQCEECRPAQAAPQCTTNSMWPGSPRPQQRSDATRSQSCCCSQLTRSASEHAL